MIIFSITLYVWKLILIFYLWCWFEVSFFLSLYIQKVCQFQYKFWNPSTRYLGGVKLGKVCEPLGPGEHGHWRRAGTAHQSASPGWQDTAVWEGAHPWERRGVDATAGGKGWDAIVRRVRTQELSKTEVVLFSESYKERFLVMDWHDQIW